MKMSRSGTYQKGRVKSRKDHEGQTASTRGPVPWGPPPAQISQSLVERGLPSGRQFLPLDSPSRTTTAPRAHRRVPGCACGWCALVTSRRGGGPRCRGVHSRRGRPSFGGLEMSSEKGLRDDQESREKEGAVIRQQRCLQGHLDPGGALFSPSGLGPPDSGVFVDFPLDGPRGAAGAKWVFMNLMLTLLFGSPGGPPWGCLADRRDALWCDRRATTSRRQTSRTSVGAWGAGRQDASFV
jgi:hypothetical protein